MAILLRCSVTSSVPLFAPTVPVPAAIRLSGPYHPPAAKSHALWAEADDDRRMACARSRRRDDRDDDYEDEPPPRRRPRQDSGDPAPPKRKLWLYSCGGCLTVLVGFCLIASIISALSTGQKRAALTEATALWDAGKQDEAVELYKQNYAAAGVDKPLLVKRIVEHELARGNKAEAQQWVERGVNDGVQLPAFDQAQANAWASKALAQRNERDAAKKQAAEQRAAQQQEKRAASNQVRANRNLPRDQFRSLVMGLNPDALIAAIGRPDDTQENAGETYWYYRNVAVDPVTGRPSAQVQIIWGNNVVREVNFN